MTTPSTPMSPADVAAHAAGSYVRPRPIPRPRPASDAKPAAKAVAK